MYVTDKAEIVIDASSEDIWEYVTDPVHWTASNPEEHYGLEYDTPDNRPREGATFHQAEEVAGMYADLHGRFQYIDHQVAVWAGTAYYPLLRGLVTVRIPEGGTIRLEETEDGTRMSRRLDGLPEQPTGTGAEMGVHDRSRWKGKALRPYEQGTRLLQGPHRISGT